jgi:hypothetical protein
MVITSATTRHTTGYLTANGTAQALFSVRAAASPIPVYPANNDTGIPLSVTIKWRKTPVDSFVILYVDTGLNSPLLTIDTIFYPDTQKTKTLTVAGAHYTYAVVGVNPGGTAVGCPPGVNPCVWTFKTASSSGRRINNSTIIGIGTWIGGGGIGRRR